MNAVLYSSKSDEWSTPQSVFDSLNAEFHFTLDPCATEQNHKCKTYYTKDQDGLLQNWGGNQYFAIRHILKLAHGLKRRIAKEERIIRLSFS